MTELLSLKPSETGHFFSMIFVVYLGHGPQHAVRVAVLLFFKSVLLGRGLKHPN